VVLFRTLHKHQRRKPPAYLLPEGNVHADGVSLEQTLEITWYTVSLPLNLRSTSLEITNLIPSSSWIVPSSTNTTLSSAALVEDIKTTGTDLTVAIALANLLATQVLEPRAKRAIDIVVLARKSVLSWITKRIMLVAPVSAEVEPVERRVRRHRTSAENIRSGVVRKGVCVQHRIPERAAIRDVVKQSPWQHIGMHAGCGIHGMGTSSRVYNRLDMSQHVKSSRSKGTCGILTLFPDFSTASYA
jgi:hypothetical protein